MGILLEPAKVMLVQIGTFLPKLLFVIVVLLIGWLISRLVKNIVANFLKLIKLDKLADDVGVNKFLSNGGVKLTLSELLGVLVYWLVLLVTFMIAIDILGLTAVGELINKIVGYIPNVIAAIFIMIIGMFAAAFIGNMVTATATNAGITQSKLLGKITQLAIIIFSVLLSLDQMQIAKNIVLLASGIVLASIGLGLALAIGLGCKDIVRDFVEDLIKRLKSK